MILLTVVVLGVLTQVLHLYVRPLRACRIILILVVKLPHWLGLWVKIVDQLIVIHLLRGQQILLIITLIRTTCRCLVWG